VTGTELVLILGISSRHCFVSYKLTAEGCGVDPSTSADASNQ